MAKTHSQKKSAAKRADAPEGARDAGSIEQIVEAVNLAARAQTDAEIAAKKAAVKAVAKQEALVELRAAAAAAELRAKRSAKELAVAQAAAKLAAREAKKAAKKVDKAASAKKSARAAAVRLAEQTRAARERLDAVPPSERGMFRLPPETVVDPSTGTRTDSGEDPGLGGTPVPGRHTRDADEVSAPGE